MNRDQFLTEMIGECWHDISIDRTRSFQVQFYKNNNFFTPEGFFKLWNFCKEQEWWVKFHDFNGGRIIQYENELIPDIEIYINPYLINPNTFANAVAKFRGWKKEQ